MNQLSDDTVRNMAIGAVFSDFVSPLSTLIYLLLFTLPHELKLFIFCFGLVFFFFTFSVFPNLCKLPSWCYVI